MFAFAKYTEGTEADQLGIEMSKERFSEFDVAAARSVIADSFSWLNDRLSDESVAARISDAADWADSLNDLERIFLNDLRSDADFSSSDNPDELEGLND